MPESLAILQLLEQLIPVAISIYKQIATGTNATTKTIDQLLADADVNFNQVISNSKL